ncbi:right-handed parallel beta-helix repeat-containing protein [Streptomyces sp. ISL-36]|uniref:right-handed parallel beta-helix repeat-containing protein n=1 Tax=Streptomyces sp. ISL-36 TaxID=2819182 RepID=UPI001BE658C5|nr:right-handed parallel beta-helix repeat-containing protein [Streptomyces sp. ISL-36]MBT2440125.1 right-handed parallel beta-helix repeat-containing protein [Streptomyces sp. ISL-36]
MVTRYVVSPWGGRRAHRDITSALRAAAARGRAALIEIAPGRYEEALTVRGEVRLVATEGPGTVVVSRPRGAVLDTFGSVHVQGLTLTGRDADVVGCHAGTLTLEHTEIRAHNGVGLHARPNTSVTLRDSVVLHGRTLFTGAGGLVERCRFTAAADNAIAVIEGAHVAVRDSRIEDSRIHGVRVSDARAEVTGCELTGTGEAALMADARAELTVANCVITAVHGEGIMFVEQSRGSVDDTRVTDARHGIAATTGADPVVRRCVLTDCRDTGIIVQSAARGRFEDCLVVDAGNVAVFSTEGGAPEVHGGRIAGGNVGIAVTDGARGRFAGIGIADLTGTALRVWDGSRGVFEHIRVDRCPSGLDTRGDGGTTADLADVAFRDFAITAVTALGHTRITLKDVSAERGVVGFGAGEEAQLFVHDSGVTAVRVGGAVAYGTARLVARNLTVNGSEGTGLSGANSAYLDVADSEFSDCATAGAIFADECAGRLVDCAVSGTRGAGVLHNGRVDLVSLRTSLTVLKETVRTVEPTPTIITYDGPVFHGPVSHAQFAWNNDNVVQQQTEEDGPRT